MGIDMLNQLMCELDEREVLKDSKEKSIKEISEKLSSGEFLWRQDLVSEIKELFKDEKVVVFDMDGVLVGYGKELGQIINTEGVSVVSKLKEDGYKVVLWTSAVRPGLIVLQPEVLNSFDLIITRENYYLTSGDFDRSGIPRRGEVNEKYYHELINGYDGYSDRQRNEAKRTTSQIKRSELLFDRSILLDDDYLHVSNGVKTDLPEGKVVVCDFDKKLFFSQLNLLKYSVGAISGDIQSDLRYMGVWVVGEVNKLFDDFEKRRLYKVK